MTPDLITHFKASRKCSVPILAISSPDQGATIASISQALNGGNKAAPREWGHSTHDQLTQGSIWR
jgi:hypothetical protein